MPSSPHPTQNNFMDVHYFIMDCARCAWAYRTKRGILLWTCPGTPRFFLFFSLTDCVSFMRSCWLWPAAHTPDHDSSCTAPHRHTASPASADTKMDKVVTNDSGHLDLLQSGDKDSVRISGFFNWHISQIIKDQWETNEPRDWFQLLSYVKNDFSICDSDSYWSGLSFTDH